jgi:hypothetical protein
LDVTQSFHRAEIDLAVPGKAVLPSPRHFGGGARMRAENTLQQIFLTAMDHPLRGKGLPGPELVLFDHNNVVARPSEGIAEPKAGNAAPKNNHVIVAGHVHKTIGPEAEPSPPLAEANWIFSQWAPKSELA